MPATVSTTFFRRSRRLAAGLAAGLALGALSAHAAPTPFPADFRSSQVVNADATINVRVGGHGPAVVLIHGFGDTGDMWSPMATELAKDHTVVVPDLRGMGLSSHPPAATTSGRRPATSAPSSTSSASSAATSWATTSARWSRMPTRRAIRTRQAAWS